ncbi:MAG: hypothetical protein LBT73_02915 [Tannerellaceae bacterium]|jgi:hypothetical protein|nr:hypothetical protein [Tannerellaceae bacterium]
MKKLFKYNPSKRNGHKGSIKEESEIELHKFTDLLRGVNKSVHICSQRGVWRKGEKEGEKRGERGESKEERAKKNFRVAQIHRFVKECEGSR